MRCETCGCDNPQRSRFCGECGISVNTAAAIGLEPVQDNPIRYHGLDALRGMAMLLGIVLHAALPYTWNMEIFWPADERPSQVITTIYHFIHIWRMPLFFILVGFFANLVITKKSWKDWWGNRLLRIGLPIIVFSPLMSLTVPWIFKYGLTGELTFFYSTVGQPHHLWFLWHLIIFVILTSIFRLCYLMGVRVITRIDTFGLDSIGIVLDKFKSVLSNIIFRSRFPIGFIFVCCVMNLASSGELIVNPGASLLYFAFGYSLYRNPFLFLFLKNHWKYYFIAGAVSFILFMIATLRVSHNFPTDIYDNGFIGAVETENKTTHILALLQYPSKIICAVLFSCAFIGLAEKRFGVYNARLRFISDGAYWMYLIHLPIVTLITFAMFNLHIPGEIKFLIAVVVTSVICLGTYKYFVRSSPIGILLNGRRYPLRVTEQ